VTYSSIKAGSDATFDNGSEGSNTGVLADSESQITALTVTNGFDAVIDVNTGRKRFVYVSCEEFPIEDSLLLECFFMDHMTFTIGNNVELEEAVDFVSSEIHITLEESEFDSLIFSSQYAEDISYDAEQGILKFKYEQPWATSNDSILISKKIDYIESILIPQKFEVSAILYSGEAEGSTEFFAGEDVPAGEWTLNGNVVNIPYMPFAPGISQILYVTNSGDFDGGVYVTAHDEDGIYYDLGMVATAGKNSVTKITGQVQLALAAQDFTKGKLSIDVTVNAPDGDITVQAAYNIGSDRGFVITDQYKKSDMYEMIP
jgi:hypothetical protein